VGAGAAPSSHPARLRRRPSREEGCAHYSAFPITINNKISSEGGSQARDCRN
jgi:hypothetical protein